MSNVQIHFRLWRRMDASAFFALEGLKPGRSIVKSNGYLQTLVGIEQFCTCIRLNLFQLAGWKQQSARSLHSLPRRWISPFVCYSIADV